jgi:hypothetical protein
MVHPFRLMEIVEQLHSALTGAGAEQIRHSFFKGEL